MLNVPAELDVAMHPRSNNAVAAVCQCVKLWPEKAWTAGSKSPANVTVSSVGLVKFRTKMEPGAGLWLLIVITFELPS